HPDLLHLSLYVNGPRLVDFGAGSYVSPSLHWYRSTLAHNAPGLPRLGQVVRAGRCSAFEEKDGWVWCRVTAARLFGNGTSANRAVLAGPDYLVDLVEVVVPEEVTVELPVHPLDGVLPGGPEAVRSDADEPSAPNIQRLGLGPEYDGPEMILVPRVGESLREEEAPGPPTLALADGPPLRFLVRSAAGSGQWVQVFGYARGSVRRVDLQDASVHIELVSGAVHRVQFEGDHVSVEGHERNPLRLGGRQPVPTPSPHARLTPIPRRAIDCPVLSAVPGPAEWERVIPSEAVHVLGARHYRRSEAPYDEAFQARVAVCASGTAICFLVHVTKPTVCFRSADAPDPALDNESPDIHSDGLQCYVGTETWQGFVAVPDPGSSRVQVRSVPGPAGDVVGVYGEWSPTEDGYAMVVAVDLGRRLEAGDMLGVNLVVNEMYPGRQRRAGQLVLSGEGGWVYLRGDRERPGRAVMAEVQ
ncbi:MAG: hypothetical protein PVH40_07780, partial [Gemmatimonadales bacterium]